MIRNQTPMSLSGHNNQAVVISVEVSNAPGSNDYNITHPNVARQTRHIDPPQMRFDDSESRTWENHRTRMLYGRTNDHRNPRYSPGMVSKIHSVRMDQNRNSGYPTSEPWGRPRNPNGPRYDCERALPRYTQNWNSPRCENNRHSSYEYSSNPPLARKLHQSDHLISDNVNGHQYDHVISEDVKYDCITTN